MKDPTDKKTPELFPPSAWRGQGRVKTKAKKTKPAAPLKPEKERLL
jgi:hypothetical protein